MTMLKKKDPLIASLLHKEILRQQRGLVLIPSENYASPAVLEALSSPIQNKYSEGYSRSRYYTGNAIVDEIETEAIDRAKKLFGCEHINVQPHSGTTANLAIYNAVLQPKDTILSLDLSHGGHLSHGSSVSLVGKMYTIVHYGVDPKTERIDLNEVERIAKQTRPKLIVTGATAYPRIIDFKRFQEICEAVNAIHVADISHIAGLCIAGVHPNPTPWVDIFMTTTHKTLAGPRGAVIGCKESFAKKIDRAIFPGTQGGPFGNVIAAKAVCFKEAQTPAFLRRQKQTVLNAAALAQSLRDSDIRLVSGGTDNHLMLIDCTDLSVTAKEATIVLESLGIYTNFNTIPFDTRSPLDPSGIRIGTPALTTRGMKEKEMRLIGTRIADILKNPTQISSRSKAKKTVKELTDSFPIYTELT